MRTGLLWLVTSGLVLSGCATAVTGDGSATPHFPSSANQPASTPATTAAPTSPATGGWIAYDDAATKVRFQLPGRTTDAVGTETTSDGIPLTRHRYRVYLANQALVSVATLHPTDPAQVVRWSLTDYLGSIVSQAQTAGFTHVSLVGVKTVSQDGRPATSTRVVAMYGSAEVAWLIRAAVDGSTFVIMQVILVSPDATSNLASLTATMSRLTAHVVLP